MILKRYCIDCGKIEPSEGVKCCPDSRVFWVEKEAAERINATNHASLKTFESVVAECHQLKVRLAEFGDGHPEWMKRIQRERKEERERIIAHLGTAFLGFVAHDPEKHLFMVGTENIRAAIESMP